MLHVEVEHNDVALKVVRHLDDILERGRDRPSHGLLELFGRDFLFAIGFGDLSFSEGRVFTVERFDGGCISVPFFGFLPLSMSFGHHHGAVQTELIVWVVNGNDATMLPFLASHMLERTGLDMMNV